MVNYKQDISQINSERVEENNLILKEENINSKLKSYNFNMPKNKENINENIISNQ